jgi:hypothetical protein
MKAHLKLSLLWTALQMRPLMLITFIQQKAKRLSSLREIELPTSTKVQIMDFDIDFDREEDGRWIAEIERLAGVLAYGATREEAQAKAEALARAVILKAAS